MTKRFEELLFEVPECNDFRRLSSGDWVAYSTRVDAQGKAIRCIAPSIRAALEALQNVLA